MSPLAKTILIISGVGAAAAVALALRKRAPGGETTDTGDDDIPSGGDMFENQDTVMAVGEATDPSVKPLLDRIRDDWKRRGIDLSVIDPAQFYVMSKATHKDGPDEDEKPSAIIAVASEATWDRTGDFVAEVLEPILKDIVRRGTKRSHVRLGGFREGYGSDGHGTGSYNKVVGGAKNSRHVDGDASDIIPTGGSGTAHNILMAIARFKVDHPGAPIGFGAYANNGHVDIGGRRNWSGDSVPKKAEKYIALAEKEAAIA